MRCSVASFQVASSILDTSWRAINVSIDRAEQAFSISASIVGSNVVFIISTETPILVAATIAGQAWTRIARFIDCFAGLSGSGRSGSGRSGSGSDVDVGKSDRSNGIDIQRTLLFVACKKHTAVRCCCTRTSG